jgi:hypothetical protein
VNDLAAAYVRLVLAMGLHDEDYVDAYHGPPEWRAEVEREQPQLAEIHHRATQLSAELARAAPPTAPEASSAATSGQVDRLRHVYLTRQLAALIARAEQLQGRRFTFDEESRALYDAVAPTHTEDELAARVSQLEREVPHTAGAASLPERLAAYRKRFVIPPDRIDAVFSAAIDECRRRTALHIPLPAKERFTVEQVTGKSAGYRQVLVRLQLVPGPLRQPDPGQRRPPHLPQPCARSGRPRGLPRPSRL